MRPDVAEAFDRMAAAAAADGLGADHQERLPQRRRAGAPVGGEPEPEVGRASRQVAPPARDRARPRPAGRIRLARATTRSGSGSSSATRGSPGISGTRATPARARSASGRGDGERAVPNFVPERFADAIARAAQRWNVSAALISAQIYAESNFNPFARSPAGAQGIAQFMPGTARAYGLSNPFDADAAIDAQAHLMRDLLRRFASVPLALAAYNAGPGAGGSVRMRAAVSRDARLRGEDPRAARRRGGGGRRRARGAARRVNSSAASGRITLAGLRSLDGSGRMSAWVGRCAGVCAHDPGHRGRAGSAAADPAAG